MIKLIKRILLGSISILGLSLGLSFLFLFNPQWSYANNTQIDMVTVYHEQELSPYAERVILEAVDIIKQADIYNDEMSIDLCLNDHPYYHKFFLLPGAPLAQAFMDKAIMENCEVDFENNRAKFSWAINHNQERSIKLSDLLAHEFTHNLQYATNWPYILRSTMGRPNWKLEGHAEYVAKRMQGDNKLSQRVAKYLEELEREHVGIPVFELEDGTIQNMWYFKNSIIVQYLYDIKGYDYQRLCKKAINDEEALQEVIAWYQSN